MPYTIEYSFSEFYSEINLSGDHRTTANSRRDAVISKLSNLNLIDSFSTGSIPRYTALSRNSDLDLIVVLHYAEHVKGKKPSQVLQLIRDELSKYRTKLRRNGQAVTLFYTDWPNVDVVPVSRCDNSDGSVSYYNVPNMRDETWLRSKPRAHSANVRERASTVGEKFRQIICMFKHWNLKNGGLLQSYHIEAIAVNSISSDDTYCWMANQFFSSLRSGVDSYVYYYLGGDAAEYIGWQLKAKILDIIDRDKEKASKAWLLTYGENDRREEAIAIWREIFGPEFPQYG